MFSNTVVTIKVFEAKNDKNEKKTKTTTVNKKATSSVNVFYVILNS